MMHEIVSIIFARLGSLDDTGPADGIPTAPDTPPGAPGSKHLHELHAPPPPPPTAAAPAPDQASPPAVDGDSGGGGEPVPASTPEDEEGGEQQEAQPEAPAAPAPEQRSVLSPPGGIVSVAAPVDTREKAADEPAPPVGAGAAGYGLPCITTIFEYVISWISSDKQEEVVFGLDLVVAALGAGGQGGCWEAAGCVPSSSSSPLAQGCSGRNRYLPDDPYNNHIRPAIPLKFHGYLLHVLISSMGPCGNRMV